MARKKAGIQDIDTAIRIYYQYPELESAEIQELFGGCISDFSIHKRKKEARKLMIEREIFTWSPTAVETKSAYEAWEIDVESLEIRREKLKELGMYVPASSAYDRNLSDKKDFGKKSSNVTNPYVSSSYDSVDPVKDYDQLDTIIAHNKQVET